MGGRGLIQKFDNSIPERFQWIKDVSTGRLQNYIKRSRHLGKKLDPEGRHIHTVGYYAKIELEKRLKK